MIIAGFAGVGKTTFCQKYENALDFVCMPFKYRNFYQVAEELNEEEDIKASEELLLRIGWEEYYYYALVDTYRKYPDQILVIPTINKVISRLMQDEIPITIVYPAWNAKDEYARRYRERGNTDSFFSVFIDRWDEWMKTVRNQAGNQGIELGASEYLTDIIKPVSYEKNKIIINKDAYIFETYFKNGWAKDFLQTPFGKMLNEVENRWL